MLYTIISTAVPVSPVDFNGASLVAIGASLAVILGTVVAIARPWGEKAKAKRQANKIFKIWMNGQPEVKGVFDAVIAAPVQMANMKKHMELQDLDLNKVKNGLTSLGEKFVQGQERTSREIKELRDLLVPNGGDTNNPGDLQMRKAKREGDWIDET